MAKEYKITSMRLADLEKELNYLKTTLPDDTANYLWKNILA